MNTNIQRRLDSPSRLSEARGQGASASSAGRRRSRLFALVVLAAPEAEAVELRDGLLVSAGSAVLENEAGSIRLENGQLGGLGPKVVVPEPGSNVLISVGAGFLFLLGKRRSMRSTTFQKIRDRNAIRTNAGMSS